MCSTKCVCICLNKGGEHGHFIFSYLSLLAFASETQARVTESICFFVRTFSAIYFSSTSHRAEFLEFMNLVL